MGIDVGAFGKKGRDWFGIYPLRGKILNVRNSTSSVIAKNREITDIIQALNIRYGVDYKKDENFDTLNYGKVMLLCDSDCDGLHISGLIINLFHSLFPTILERDSSFIINMKTPLVRIYMKNDEICFYSTEEYKKYILENPDNKGRVKYFKGLGTSSDKEVRNSFGKKVVQYIRDEKTDDNMNKVFHKKFSDQRKVWLEEYDPKYIVDIDIPKMSISDFVDREMIKFSIDDCKRSIPNVIDGFKESHRKIIYASFLKNLKYSGKTMKVAQLSGFVAEKTNYHHGEQCLFDTITKLAHDFVGSNNIPLLYRDGQFGT
jgi:DNA topoisomerase-2